MSNPFSPLILPTEDNRGLQSSLLTVIDALNVLTPRLGAVEDILAAAGLATRRIGAIPMTWLGVWTASFVYLHGDVVTRNLLLMIANKTTTETPTLSANDWDLLVDATGGGASSFSYARVAQATVTPITDGNNFFIMEYDDTVDDPNNLHSETVDNSRIFADVDGLWTGMTQFQTLSNTTEWGLLNVALVVLSGGTIAVGQLFLLGPINSGFDTPAALQVSGGEFRMNAGDSIQTLVQLGVTPTGSSSGNTSTWMSLRRIGD